MKIYIWSLFLSLSLFWCFAVSGIYRDIRNMLSSVEISDAWNRGGFFFLPVRKHFIKIMIVNISENTNIKNSLHKFVARFAEKQLNSRWGDLPETRCALHKFLRAHLLYFLPRGRNVETVECRRRFIFGLFMTHNSV